MKCFGVKPYLFPMPTYMIGTYNEDDSIDVMMMAWGGSTPCCRPLIAYQQRQAGLSTAARMRRSS